jgi:hypothetical protein
MIYFNIFIISWLITNFKPIKMMLELIPYRKLKPIPSIIATTLILPLTCLMCACFWIGLIWTGNIITAATTSLIGYLWSQIQKKIEYEKF